MYIEEATYLWRLQQPASKQEDTLFDKNTTKTSQIHF